MSRSRGRVPESSSDSRAAKKGGAEKGGEKCFGRRRSDRAKISLGSSANEHPILARLGLYASDTVGDGNCLFRALSDQIYGTESQHAVVRAIAVKEIIEHEDQYAGFAGAEFGESFQQYTHRLARDGAYGGHLEIAAFATANKVEIAIYQADSVWVLRPPHLPADCKLSRLHIAYHSWEHYSSVRNISGPHHGLPLVSLSQASGPKQIKGSRGSGKNTCSAVPQWQLDLALRTVPDATPQHAEELISKLGYDDAVEAMLMEMATQDADEASGGLATEGARHTQEPRGDRVQVEVPLPEPETPLSPGQQFETGAQGKGVVGQSSYHHESRMEEGATILPNGADTPPQELSRKQIARRAREQRLREARERKAERQRAKKNPDSSKSNETKIGIRPDKTDSALTAEEIYI